MGREPLRQGIPRPSSQTNLSPRARGSLAPRARGERVLGAGQASHGRGAMESRKVGTIIVKKESLFQTLKIFCRRFWGNRLFLHKKSWGNEEFCSKKLAYKSFRVLKSL